MLGIADPAYQSEGAKNVAQYQTQNYGRHPKKRLKNALNGQENNKRPD